MSNTWFQFKQFTIHQDKSAMKVCTDSCVFGATVPVKNAQYILDIGTGTGLIALMLAQRSSAVIDAVEIDTDAAVQARQNFEASPWKDRITIHHSSIQDYFKYTVKNYDCIVCNPPFFFDSMKSGSVAKDMALHQTYLPISELMKAAFFMLKDHGDAYFLISIYEEERFLKAALDVGFHCRRDTSMYDNPTKLIRYILHMKKESFLTEAYEKQFSIRNQDGHYSQDFTEALSDFYLYL